MKSLRCLRTKYLLLTLRTRRRDVKGFSKRAGKGAGRDKLNRMHRAQQKALCARESRRQARRGLIGDDIEAGPGSMLQYARESLPWTRKKRKRMRRLYKRAIRRLFDGLDASAFRLPSGELLLAPGHEIQARSGWVRLARLRDLQTAVHLVVVDRQLDDATFNPAGRVLY